MMLQDSRQLRHLDTGVLASTILIVICGLIAIYSATNASESDIGHITFKKQLLWAFLGLGILGIMVFIPLRFFFKYAVPIYIGSIMLLVVVMVIGIGAGAKRWIPIGPFWLQPAELAKVATVLILARYLSYENRNLGNMRELAIPFILVGIPLLLTLRQPDLGSALVFFAVILPILHWAGLSNILLFVLVAPLVSLVCAFNYYTFLGAMIVISLVLFLSQKGIAFFLTNFFLNIGVGVLTPVFWSFLKEYQKKRILTFIGLETDPRGLGYQVIQSKVAIGSGGLTGKGYLQGTQTHLRFLPEQHTDFIFGVIGEEFGFIGVVVVLSLFLYLLLKSIKVAANVKSRFASLVVFGGVIILLFQIMVNLGMTVDILPVTGLPLPFLSYGGSSLLTSMMLIGLILNASRSRFEYM